MAQIAEVDRLKKELKESKKKEKELQERNEELTDFIENASLPLHWVDDEGNVIWANNAELETLGYSKDEYVGHPITDFHADREVIDDILKRLANKETLINYPARLKCKDGSIKHVLINSNVLWRDGKFIHTRCFTRDITSLKIEQKRKNKLLMELAQFAYIASHDLRTPLRAIGTLTDLMQLDYKDKLDDKGNEYLRLVKFRINKMFDILDGILKYSKINLFNPAKEKLVKVDTDKIFHEAINEQIENSDKKVTFKVLNKLPEIYANKLHIYQVIENLLNNAIVYCDKPEVKITAGCRKKSSNGNWEFFIKDNGPGIEPDYKEKIFKLFQSLHITPGQRGVGIGLTLVKKIVDIYQGEIWFESEKGQGCTFYFTLPKKRLKDFNS